MNILITGVAGFIGFNFSSFLLKNTNHKIIGIDNINNYYPKKIKRKRLMELKKFKNFKFHKIDLKNQKKLDAIFKSRVDIVYHFAAQAGVRYSLVNPRAYIDSNIFGFFNLINNIKKNKIKKFFYASSSSVYGERKKFPLKENDPINPKNIYGLTKKNNEEMVEIFFRGTNTKVTGLRFFTVFGEWGRPDMLVYKYLESLFNRKKIFFLNNYGNHTRDFTYIEDVCLIMFKLLGKRSNKHHQIFNICSNNPVKITSVINRLNSNFKNKIPNIKKRAFQLADVKKTHGHNKNIKQHLNIKKFHNINKALDKTCAWYSKNWKIYS